MSLFSKKNDYTKPDKVESDKVKINNSNSTVEITVTHAKGEEWCFDIQESKLTSFYFSLSACFVGTSNYVQVDDIDGDTFIFGNELLKNSGIMITK